MDHGNSKEESGHSTAESVCRCVSLNGGMSCVFDCLLVPSCDSLIVIKKGL